jgi:O-antigen/teichoic acid export membrane protein
LEILRNLITKKYLKNTSWLFLDKLAKILFGFIVGAIVARYLGPSNFGLYSYAITLVSLIMSIAPLGLNSILVKEFLNNKSQSYIIAGTAIRLIFLSTITLLIITLILNETFILDSELRNIILILAFSNLFSFLNVIDFFFQSKVLSKYVIYSSITSLLISSLYKLYLVSSESTLLYFALSILLERLLFYAFMSYHYIKYDTNFKIVLLKFKPLIAKKLLKNSWPLILNAIIITLYMKIDQVMIKNMIGDQANGFYSSAVRISESIYFIPVILTSSFFPALLNAKKISDNLYIKRFEKLSSLLLLISSIFCILITLYAENIIALLYGEEFLEAASVLKIHAWSAPFVFFGVLGSKWFIIENKTKLGVFRTLLGLFSNVLLNMFLIPFYGINGSALATLLSYFIAGFISDLLLKETLVLFKIKICSFNFLKLLKQI